MRTFLILLAPVVLALAHPVTAQEMPAECAAALKPLSRQGDYKDGVLKVNIPRNDVNVSIDGVATPTPFGFGGWIALTKGDHGDVMMGELVLTENEVNPVMSAVLDNGLEVTTAYSGVAGLELANRKEIPPLTDDAPSIHVSEKLRPPPM